ncbi:hypothetical protein ONE63_007347 [Megalurothrips usitatus]|uniref:Uncharacterized protein n=1 Tax=Megalurothrips usitatus TaxID=439358 RepID=A0AAV7XRS2_9NEOP|nr:hypothetical protein ONE63_007347 [Megalurothrips usitatus]
MSAGRLRAFRLAWLRVQGRAWRGDVMPATCVLHMTVLLLLCTLAAYTATLSAAAGAWVPCGFATSVTLLHAASILAVNDSAQRLSDAIQSPFLDTLLSSRMSCSVDVDLAQEALISRKRYASFPFEFSLRFSSLTRLDTEGRSLKSIKSTQMLVRNDSRLNLAGL